MHTRALDATDLYVELGDPRAVRAICSTLDEMLECEACGTVWLEWRKDGRTKGIEPHRVVVPLERFGGTPGASGAQVYVGYYRDGRMHYRSSKPFLIKAAPYPRSGQDRIKEECTRASEFEAAICDHRQQFAIPLYLKEGVVDDCHSVLLAPYSSAAKRANSGVAHRFAFSDLWTLLLSNDPRVAATIDEVLEVLTPTHLRGRVRAGEHAERHLLTEYDWYLREMHRCRRPYMEGLFGSSPRIRYFGKQWPNPLYLIDSYVGKMAVDLVLGPVHGDLHPKNIVLGNHGEVNLIDFYWAQSDSHILKDYLLLEANLRFVTMPSCISRSEATLAAEFGISDVTVRSGIAAATSDTPTELLRRRLQCIGKLRQHAQASGLVRENWITEYLCPLFLVTFGLVRHLDSVYNQAIAVLSLLNLGKRIEDYSKAPQNG